MFRTITAAALVLALAQLTHAAAPLVYYDFQTNFANKGSGGATYDATVTGLGLDPGFTGGTVGLSSRPSGVSGAALSTERTDAAYITMPAGTTQLGNNFTLSTWFYLSPASAPGANRFYVFEGSSNFDVSFGTPSGGPTTSFTSFVGETGSFTTTGLAADAWHHVLQSFSTSGANTNMAVYIDGNLVSGAGQTAATSAVNFAGVNIGNARTGQARYWDGLLDEHAAWNSALTAAEAAQVYHRGINGLPITSVPFTNGVIDPNVSVNIAAAGWDGDFQAPVAGAANDLMDAGFQGQFFRTQGAGDNTLTFTYTGLPEHNQVQLGMLLGQLESLDPARDGDRFIVRVDGQTIFSGGFGYGTSVDNAFSDVIITTGDPALDAELLALRTLPAANLYGGTNFLENVYNLNSFSKFGRISHSGSTITLEIIGRQNQASGEFFALDNVSLQLSAPEPSSAATFGLMAGVLGLGVWIRRRRSPTKKKAS